MYGCIIYKNILLKVYTAFNIKYFKGKIHFGKMSNAETNLQKFHDFSNKFWIGLLK